MLLPGWSSSGSQILAIHIQETSNPKRKIKDTIMPELIQEPEAPVSSTTAPSSPLKKPPGEGTGPTMNADFPGNLVGRVPSRGERDVFQQTARKVSRRNMLMTFGIALNAIAGVLFAVPVVGY